MAKRRKRNAMVAAALGAAALAPARPLAEPAKQVAPSPADVIAALARQAVSDADYGRRALYTWTTEKQITALRSSKQLLVKTESRRYGASYLEQVVYALAQKSDPIAKLLFTEAYAKMRFAWPVPWATRGGFADEEYGDEVIAVTLKPSAIIVAISSDRGVIDARDVDNKPVALADVARAPERIAAIYFTSSAGRPTAAGVPTPPSTYREYALCNEAMIESWAVGSDAISREIADEISLLERVAPEIGNPRVAAAYDAALALHSPVYTADGAIAGIVTKLRATKWPRAFAGASTAKFAGVGAARKPPRVVRYGGSYGGTFGP